MKGQRLKPPQSRDESERPIEGQSPTSRKDESQTRARARAIAYTALGTFGVALLILGGRIILAPPVSVYAFDALALGAAAIWVGCALVGFSYLSIRRLELRVERATLRSLVARTGIALLAVAIGVAFIAILSAVIYRPGGATWTPVADVTGSGSQPSVTLVTLNSAEQQLWFSGARGVALHVFLIPAPEGTTPTVPLGGPSDLHRVVNVNGADGALLELTKQPGRYILYVESAGSWSVKLLER